MVRSRIGSPGALRLWFAVHRWTSLVCTLVLLLLCLTGLPLILKEEIGHWSGTTVEPPAMPAQTPRISIDRLVADARARRPGDAIRFVSQSDDQPAWFVSMGVTADAAEATAVFKYDARTGLLLRDIEQRSGLIYVLRTLHVELFAGLRGTLFIGAMGVLFIASVISGIVVYAPFMRRLEFGTLRLRRSARLRWLDLHNLLGIVLAMWMLVVGTTGVINALAQPLLSHWRTTELAAMTAPWRGRPPPAAFSSVQAAIDTALRAAPGMEVSFVGYPGSRFATPHHYMVFLHGDAPLTARLLRPVMIDAETGALTVNGTLPWYLTAVLVSQPLHFGDYGGLPLKIIWLLLTLATIAVLASGLVLWWRKGARQERMAMPVPEVAE